MLRRTLAAAALLSMGTLAQAAVLVDFGTDPGQVQSGTAGVEYQLGYGTMTAVRSFTADTMTLAYTAGGAWQNRGEQYRGAFFQAMDVTGWNPTDTLAMTGRFIIGTPAPDYYLLTMTLYALDGSTSTYQFIPAVRTNPTPFNYGTDPGSVPFSTVLTTTDLGHPTATNATLGGFDFAADTFNGFDLLLQVAFNPGSTTLEIDSIEVAPVPEPTSIAALGTLGLIALRRRRA